jgi:anti-sigma factor RsiW
MRDCAFLREVAAELALGILTGPDRSAALAHMDRCARCQAEVASLAEAADRLLGLAPARGAPDGFEGKVTAAFGQTLPEPTTERRRARPARRGFAGLRWRPCAVAAAVAAAGMLGFWLHGTITTPQPPTYDGAVVVALRTPAGVPAGDVAVTGASRHWLVMVVNANAAPGWYHCYLRTSGGQQIPAGAFRVGPDGGVWVSRLPFPESKLTGARLVGPGGTQAASATFS